MYRIRFHGRGGQGMKTASRILGSAFFAEGFEVQDAPRYGAERRGAPLFATVRAAHEPIHERGAIVRPDVVVVADDTLVPVPAAGVTAGVDEKTVLLLASEEPPETWRERLRLPATILTLPLSSAERRELRFVGAACAAAAARTIGAIGWPAFEGALCAELAPLGPETVESNREHARAAWDAFAPHAGLAAAERADGAVPEARPDWIELPFEEARVSAPGVHASVNSVEVRTGLWRTMRPVIDYDRCRRCSWLCSTLCPDGAILVDAGGAPRIDLDHCKGCMICVAVCPTHAIASVPEREAARADEAARGEEATP